MEYKTGDILVVPIKYLPFFNHLAIVFYKDGIAHVAHHVGYSAKRVTIEPLTDFLKTREVKRVIPTNGLTDEYIYNKVTWCNEDGKTYSVFGFNCEDFIRDVCGCSWGIEQKKRFYFGVIIFILVIIGLYFLIKKNGI